MRKVCLVVLMVASVGWWRIGVAQHAAVPLPVYDAVVIKVNHGVSGRVTSEIDGNVFRAVNVTLKHLLVNAYGVREGLLFGLPGWADSVRFDVTAKVSDPDKTVLQRLSHEQWQAMLAAVLVNRFHLEAHIEVKTLPVYELVVAKGGSKLTAAKGDETRLTMMSRESDREVTAVGVTLEHFAQSPFLPVSGHPVVDQTGLKGRYDCTLRWSPEGGGDSQEPALFTAIQEQLGLRLVPAKAPVEVIVIDHVEKPSGN